MDFDSLHDFSGRFRNGLGLGWDMTTFRNEFQIPVESTKSNHDAQNPSGSRGFVRPCWGSLQCFPESLSGGMGFPCWSSIATFCLASSYKIQNLPLHALCLFLFIFVYLFHCTVWPSTVGPQSCLMKSCPSMQFLLHTADEVIEFIYYCQWKKTKYFALTSYARMTLDYMTSLWYILSHIAFILIIILCKC